VTGEPRGPPTQPVDAVPAPDRSRRRRWWVWPVAVLVQVLLLAVLVLVWVLGTESGLRTALALAEDLAPGVVRVEQVQGRLARDLHLIGLEVRLPDLHLSAAELHVHWRPWGALTGALHIESVVAQGLSIATRPSPPDPKPLTLPALVLPVGIEVGHALVEGLSISELREDPPPPFVVERIALAAGLHAGRLELHELSVDLPEFRLQARAQGQGELAGDYPLGVELAWTLTLDPKGPEAEPVTLNGGGRVSGDLSRLRIDYRITGAVELDLTVDVTGVLSAPAWDGRVELHRVDLPAFDPGLPAVDLHGTLVTAGDRDQASVRGRLDGQATGAASAAFPGHLEADLDLAWAGQALTIRALRLEEDSSGGFLTAEGTLDPQQGRIDLKGDWAGLRWPLAGPAQVEVSRGKITLTGALDAYRYDLTAEVAGADIPAATLALEGEGNLQSSRIGSLRIDTLGGQIDGSGDLAWDPAPRWDLKLVAKDLDPGHLAPDFGGRVAFTAASAGTPDGYDLRLQGETGPGAKGEAGGRILPAATIDLTATGDLRSARVSTLHLDTLGGRIDGKGEGTWESGLTWDAELTADGIDPSKRWPDWPGRLGGRVATQGRVTAEGPDLGAQLEDIKGELRGYGVAATGKVLVVGQTVTIEEINASSGPSKARVSGTVGERMDLAFAVDSPDLGNLLPDARGSIKVDGRILGTAAAPEVKFKLVAKGVQVAGQGVQSAEGDVDLGLGPDGRFDIRLNGKDLTAVGLTWQTLEVRGDGAMTDHRLSANLKGDALSLRLEAGGALKPDNAYQGNLAELELASKDYGNWRLQRPAPIVVAQPKVSAGPLCLRDGQGGGGAGGGSGGCVRFEQTGPGKWNVDLDLDRFAFSLLTRFLPANLALQGAASLKGRFAADGTLLTGNAGLAVAEGRLEVTAGGQTQVLDFSNARLGLDSDARGLSARLHLPVADIGGADADVTLAGWRLDHPARPDQPLSGRVQARVTDLRRFASLVPDLAAVTGTIDLDLGLSGSLARPGFNGGGRVSGGGFDVPIIGLKVRNLDVSADAQSPSEVAYRGGLDLGGGRLELTGDSVREGAGWLTRVRISGQNLKVADSKQYFALISPDIGLQVTPTGLDVTGELRVPEARIRPRAIPPGTVSPSGDVVLEQTAAKQAEPFPIAADLRLVLGDAVSIDAFGLRGLLRGDLRVIKSPGREPVGDGQISVVDATYRLSGAIGVIAAVGKPLKVEQGILVFAKTPLNNPGLVLTAQREGGDVTAGVRILGTIKKPKLAFFSESDPDMSQSEITSYLVTGIPPKRGSADDARALAVGTYISPKLYMEYESNLGDSADKVKLRYELSNRIELQTETGSGQGADIFYKFEN
jgi:translocation and assembly module TamB